MSKTALPLLILLSLLSGQWAYAVSESRIWLPKKYSSAKPKLMLAAREAEQTQRCMEVVAGEMIVRKSTAEHYYFVIGCRDENFKTYNLSYRYPVIGEVPELVAEQISRNTQKKQKVEVADIGVSQQQVPSLCRNELAVVTDAQDEVTLLEELLTDPIEQADGFLYVMPYTALSELGNAARYRADCRVSKEGKAAIDITLERDGALVICLDSLRAESILLGRARVLEEAIAEAQTEAGGFRFQIPFDAKTRGSSPIRYSADCQVEADGSNDIEMTLQSLGALAICRDSLQMETFLMKSVEVAEQPLSQSRRGEAFLFRLAFTAKARGGNQRSFNADCLVDEEGEAEVTTEIDQTAIVSVCLADLKVKTKTMLEVTILEQQIPPLIEEGESFVSIIPFDAKNPSGRVLRYQAQCRVDGSGHSKIKLKARKK